MMFDSLYWLSLCILFGFFCIFYILLLLNCIIHWFFLIASFPYFHFFLFVVSYFFGSFFITCYMIACHVLTMTLYKGTLLKCQNEQMLLFLRAKIGRVIFLKTNRFDSKRLICSTKVIVYWGKL